MDLGDVLGGRVLGRELVDQRGPERGNLRDAATATLASSRARCASITR